MLAVLSAAPDFAGLARRELEAVLPAGAGLEELDPGVWLVAAPGRLADLAPALLGTTFVRHACPADTEIPVGEDLRPLATAIAGIPTPPGPPGQVQVRLLAGARGGPGAVAQMIRAALAAAGVATTGSPAQQVLSVTLGPQRAWAGWGPVAQNLSPWPGGITRLRTAEDEVARSARKLEEAVLLFGVPVVAGMRALDLGAAPGGWTGWLLGRGVAVTAVDTGTLAPALRGRPGLSFVRGSALRVPVPPGPFDLLCADLSWDPLRAAACAGRFVPALASGARGIFTVKFFGGDPLMVVARVRARLEAAGLRVTAVRHLFHNRAEATAHLICP